MPFVSIFKGAAVGRKRMARSSRILSFEKFEDRRLLAADLGAELVECDFSNEIEQCIVACEHVESTSPDLDLSTPESEVGIDVDSSNIEVQPIQLDLADGSDGYFGTISADNPVHTFQFNTTDNGQVDVVIASSMDGADTILQIHNQSGELIAASQTEHLDGFQVLTFDVDAESEYELTVSSNGDSEGRFQLTAGFVATPEPIDLHADVMGEDATELVMTDGSVELTGDLEQSGDTDVFRFTAEGNGSTTLYLGDMTEAGDADLNVVVQDANGNVLADGATNEIVMVSFDVQSDCEYYIAVDASEGQTGTYTLLMDVDLDEPLPVDDHANSIGEDATEIAPNENGQMLMQGVLESGTDSDAFRFAANQTGEMVLEMDASTTDHVADTQVSVFSDSGELIVSGSTNEDVGLRFDTTAGIQYHVLVQSLNDMPASYDLTLTQDVVDPTCVELQPVDEDPVPLDEADHDSPQIEPEVDQTQDDELDPNECDFAQLAETVFEEIGEADLFESPFRSKVNGLESLFSERLRRN